jgi:hypothetical protein
MLGSYVKLVLISLLSSSAHPIDAAIYEDSKQMTKTAAAGWAGALAFAPVKD